MTIPRMTSETPVVIQGMTGKEGQRMASWMMASGTRVVAGVTPGKGGQEVFGCPVFSNVEEMKQVFPDVKTSCVVVPSQHVLSAVTDAIEHGITFVQVLSEQVPLHDQIAMRRLAHVHGATILGPSSVGLLQFPRVRLGYLGGEKPFDVVKEGDLALVSASGGMANELVMACSRVGVGIRIAIAVGGDRCPGITVEEAAIACLDREDVRVLGMFIEPGNPFLMRLLDSEPFGQNHKPVAICVPGDGMELLPRGIPYGHAGTILGEDAPPLEVLREQIRARGISCVSSIHDFLELCQTL